MLEVVSDLDVILVQVRQFLNIKQVIHRLRHKVSYVIHSVQHFCIWILQTELIELLLDAWDTFDLFWADLDHFQFVEKAFDLLVIPSLKFTFERLFFLFELLNDLVKAILDRL